MSRIETQRSILQSEFFWFGGCQGAPKVYDGGTNFNAPPTLRNSRSARPGDSGSEPEVGDLTIQYEADDNGWTITLTEK